jgi:hypothetical protein
MLAGPGLGDDPCLAHAAGQQDLAERIVDLVAAGVIELVALEVDFRPAEIVGQSLGEIDRARPARVVPVKAGQLGLVLRVGLGGGVGLAQVQHQRHQGLGHIEAAELAELAARVGKAVPIVRFTGGVQRVLTDCGRRRGRP